MDLFIDQQETKLVGAHMSPQFHSFLTLYSVRTGWPRAKIIRKLLMAWWEKSAMIHNENDLMADLAVQLTMEWEKKKGMLPTGEVDDLYLEYVSRCRHNLLKKGLSETQTETIISKMSC